MRDPACSLESLGLYNYNNRAYIGLQSDPRRNIFVDTCVCTLNINAMQAQYNLPSNANKDAVLSPGETNKQSALQILTGNAQKYNTIETHYFRMKSDTRGEHSTF